jgi:DNA (cytosine-5)-methyltransferase 1
VVGVDIKPQPKYPFEFICADALVLLEELIDGDGVPFDAIHASPPCQAFTALRTMHNAKVHADLLTRTRELLQESALPYVIENVPGAPMNGSHVTLCGTALGLGTGDAELWRHRHFESSFPILVPPCQHRAASRVIGVYGGHGRDRRRVVGVYGSSGGRSRRDGTQGFSVSERSEAMGIDWMTGTELSQAIPPAYTEHIGAYLMDEVQRRSQTEVAA